MDLPVPIVRKPLSIEQAKGAVRRKSGKFKATACVRLEDIISCKGMEFFNDFCRTFLFGETGCFLSDSNYKVVGYDTAKKGRMGEVYIEVSGQLNTPR